MAEVQVVAFDLDDTLIRLDDDFIPKYLALLDQHLQRHFPQHGSFIQALVDTSNQMMAKPRDSESLQDFFYRDFSSRAGLAREAFESLVTTFYQEKFPQLESLAKPVYGVNGLLATLRADGYRVALLTSALFPQAAIDVRLAWAGLEAFPFDWRTAFEVVHATKPQPGYYLEAAEGLGIAPEHWIMVGNDLVEDIIPAHEAGMAVYWVHDQVTDDERLKLPPKTPVGSLHNLVAYVEGLSHRYG